MKSEPDSSQKVASAPPVTGRCNVETSESLAALIRKALEHIPVERLVISTDCGFGQEGMSRRHAFYKMADPRFSLVPTA